MKIKVVSWNMAHRSAAWDCLLGSVRPDIALLQECLPPNDANLFEKEAFLWKEAKAGWGTGVLSLNGKISEIKLEPNTHPGGLVGGRVEIGGTKMTVFSMYGLLERGSGSKAAYSTTTVHRMLSDLPYLLNGEGDYKGMNDKVLIGGDINISIQCDEKWGKRDRYTNAHRICFERFEDFGLVNCFSGKDGYTRTHRHAGSSEPWQNDYLFYSKKISRNVICAVLENDEIVRCSDHNPVVLEIEL